MGENFNELEQQAINSAKQAAESLQKIGEQILDGRIGKIDKEIEKNEIAIKENEEKTRENEEKTRENEEKIRENEEKTRENEEKIKEKARKKVNYNVQLSAYDDIYNRDGIIDEKKQAAMLTFINERATNEVEIEKITQEIENLDKEQQKLKTEKEGLDKEQQKLKTEKEGLNEEQQKLKTEKEGLEAKFNDLQSKKTKLEQDKAKLRNGENIKQSSDLSKSFSEKFSFGDMTAGKYNGGEFHSNAPSGHESERVTGKTQTFEKK